MKALLRGLAPSLVLASLLIAGCAQDVGDINRVQPNYVKKSDLTGQWYIRNTVVDVPPAAAFSFVGYTLDMEKICWEITEEYLIGYRSYELYPGKDPDADDEGKGIGYTPPVAGEGYNTECYKDAPIVAYRIQNHFDIQRQYNPGTGEQTNVIVENMSDRPWYERQYMRVNWGMNFVTNFSGDVGGMVDFSTYAQDSESGDWAFRMEDADGQSVVMDPTDPAFSNRKAPAYIDVTRRMFLNPPTYTFRNRYDVPIATYPMCWFIGQTMDCTGAEVKVRTAILKVPEVRTYEPRLFDDNRMHKFGYFRTERVTYDAHRGHTDEGIIRLANIHNVWETAYDADGEVIAPAKRTPKPIVYTLSANFPEDLVPGAEETARGWARALTRAVAAAQGLPELDVFKQFPYQETFGDPSSAYRNDGLFRLDYNEDGHARIGDLRYNFIYWVDTPQQRSPLGYGPSSVDPETGEVISAQAFVYGASLTTYAQTAKDMVDAINGDLPIDEEFFTGQHVIDYLARNRDRVDPRRRLSLLGREDLLDRPLSDFSIENAGPEMQNRIAQLREQGPRQIGESTANRLDRIKGTPLEDYLVNDELRADLAARTGNLDLAMGDITGQLMGELYPMTVDLDEQLRAIEHRQNWAAENSIWLAEYSDSAVSGLAKRIKEEMDAGRMTEEDVYTYLRAIIFRGVTEHEVGHTLGLRHNFQGSYDSINFFDQYWQLKKESLYSNPTLEQMLTMSDLTPAQEEGRMREYQYSSIMDYGSRFNSDVHGLGKYDEAAILFGYADHVEVFTDVGQGFRDRYFSRYSDGTTRFESNGSPAYRHMLDVTHYSRIPYMMGDGNVNMGLTRLMAENRTILPWETVKAYQDMDEDSRPIEVPYMFCSDEYASAIPSCHRWDMGADTLEQVRNVTQSWWDHYYFNNFRRNRYGWSTGNAMMSIYSRYFLYLPNLYQHWVLNDVAFKVIDDPLMSDVGYIASAEGLNLLANAITMPAYGSYFYCDGVDDPSACEERVNEYIWVTYDAVNDEPEISLQVLQGDGRRSFSRYDYNRGYYYYQYPLEMGHYWEFQAALFALINNQATVRGVEANADFSTYQIGYYDLFPTQITSLWNSVITEDFEEYAPRLVPTTTGTELVVQKPALDLFGEFDLEDPTIAAAPVVRPEINYTDRWLMLYLGNAGFNTRNLHYADSHRIFRLGSGETLEPSAGYEVVRFDHDTQGIVYAALKRLDGSDATAAVRFIERANEFKALRDQALQQAADARQAGNEQAARQWDSIARNYQWDIDSQVEWMDMERGFYQLFGLLL